MLLPFSVVLCCVRASCFASHLPPTTSLPLALRASAGDQDQDRKNLERPDPSTSVGLVRSQSTPRSTAALLLWSGLLSPVHDVLRMEVVHRREDSKQQLLGEILRVHALLHDAVEQIAAAHEVHHQVYRLVRLDAGPQRADRNRGGE